MKAVLLPDRGVVKVAGADARGFLNGLLTTDIGKVSPERAREIYGVVVERLTGAVDADGTRARRDRMSDEDRGAPGARG